MRYTKPHLTFKEQANQLILRGLVADRERLIHTLQRVNYYRLSGYLDPFRNADDTYKEGTTLEKVWRRYAYDRRLRLLLLDAIERIEISVRTQLVYHFSHKYGPFGHILHENLAKIHPKVFADWLNRLQKETTRSQEIFVEHFQRKYDEHEQLPLWMACEIMTFGSTLTFFKGVSPSIKRILAKEYRIPDEVLHSWLRALNAIRNICAHHGRIHGRELGYKPKLPYPNKYPEWHYPVTIPNNRIFGILTICRYLLRIIAPQSQWSNNFHTLLDEYSEIPRQPMGFPDDWELCPIWKED